MELSGIALAQGFWEQVVGPLLARRWPGLPVVAGRFGTGSDVLGLDDATSRDHDWGLRLSLLLDDGNPGTGNGGGDRVAEIDAHLQAALPRTWNGFPIRFPVTGDPREHHRVEVATVRGFASARLGLDPGEPWDSLDWLSVTGQSVLEVTAGPVFIGPSQTPGAFELLRRRLARYPDDVELVVVAAAWAQLAEELPLLGRTADSGDEVGSRIITARLARVAVHLGFVLEQRWSPYPKWAGSVFAGLPAAGAAAPGLRRALTGGTWREREAGLAEALGVLHAVQAGRGLPVAPRAVEPFFARPYLGVPDAAVDLLRAGVVDPVLRALPRGVGAVEQWVDAVDVLVDPLRRRALVDAWRSPRP
ncbi:DUF4037 domain-containing protein [Kineococcus gynurae]|uniref:DUF4037 domain-containing protein n=1 Tax=Kineococcus gynurae TaxID=452979 RepID=A0ABV5LSK8_9ACTN